MLNMLILREEINNREKVAKEENAGFMLANLP